MLNIRQILEAAVMAVKPAIDTQLENTTYSPKIGEPYQQLYFLPARPDTLTIDENALYQSGVFQITLCYPTGRGSKEIYERIALYAKAFQQGVKLEKGRTKVYISAPVGVNILGVDGDRFKAALSIYFKSYKI